MLLKLPAPHHHLDHHQFQCSEYSQPHHPSASQSSYQGASLWNTGLSTTVESGRVDKGQVPIVITIIIIIIITILLTIVIIFITIIIIIIQPPAWFPVFLALPPVQACVLHSIRRRWRRDNTRGKVEMIPFQEKFKRNPPKTIIFQNPIKEKHFPCSNIEP